MGKKLKKGSYAVISVEWSSLYQNYCLGDLASSREKLSQHPYMSVYTVEVGSKIKKGQRVWVVGQDIHNIHKAYAKEKQARKYAREYEELSVFEMTFLG